MTITWICSCVRSVLFPKQGNKIKVVVLNRVCILGIFCLKQCQDFKPSAAQLYSNTGRVPARDSSLSSFYILFYHTNSPLPCPFPRSSPTSTSCWPSTSTCPTDSTPLLLYLAHLSFDLHQLIGPSGLCDSVHRASFLFFPVSGCNLILFEYHSRSPPRCHWKNLARNKQFLRLVRISSWAFQRQWRVMNHECRLFSLHQSVHRCWSPR